MIYVYGITWTGTALPPLRGLDGAALHALDVGGLRVVCSTVGGTPRPGHAALLRHQEVLEAVMSRGSVLPVRFGSCFSVAADLRAPLKRHGPTLALALAEVAGHVELGVRARWAVPAPEAAPARRGSGRDYLAGRASQERARQAWRQQAQALADRLHPALLACATSARLRLLPDPGTPMASAYLVAAPRVDVFRRLVEAHRERLGHAHPDVTVHQSGPWPPYSFAPALDTEVASLG